MFEIINYLWVYASCVHLLSSCPVDACISFPYQVKYYKYIFKHLDHYVVGPVRVHIMVGLLIQNFTELECEFREFESFS